MFLDLIFMKCFEKIILEVNFYDSMVNLEKFFLLKLEVLDGWGKFLEIFLS